LQSLLGYCVEVGLLISSPKALRAVSDPLFRSRDWKRGDDDADQQRAFEVAFTLQMILGPVFVVVLLLPFVVGLYWLSTLVFVLIAAIGNTPDGAGLGCEAGRSCMRYGNAPQGMHWLRSALERAGFQLRPGQHPILPVMLGDAALAMDSFGRDGSRK